MRRIAYRLPDAARRLDVDPRTLERLRDEGLILTYRIGETEYVTDHALRDLQHRLTVATVLDPPAHARRA